MKSIAMILALTISTTTWADTQTNEEAQIQQYTQDSSEYNLKMSQIYKSLAVTAAEARVQKNLMCEEGTYTSDIVSASVTAIARASYVTTADAEKMSAELLANSDVVAVAATSFSFREATIYSTPYAEATTDIGKIKNVIVGTKFWGPGMGAYGSQISIEFISTSEVKIGALELLDQEPWSKWNYKTANYSFEETFAGIVLVVDGERFTIQKDWAWSQDGTYIIVPEGAQPDANGYLIPTYTEYQSECEA
jgi:hypothetical protein